MAKLYFILGKVKHAVIQCAWYSKKGWVDFTPWKSWHLLTLDFIACWSQHLYIRQREIYAVDVILYRFSTFYLRDVSDIVQEKLFGLFEEHHTPSTALAQLGRDAQESPELRRIFGDWKLMSDYDYVPK